MESKGKLIAFEGVDGAGKGTQVSILEKRLKEAGKKVIVYAFPRYSHITGEVIAEYLRGEYGDINTVPKRLICVAYAADRITAMKEIKQYLDDGYIVLCDRYTYSNIFTAAKMPKTEWDNFINWVEDLEFNNLNIIKPDCNVFLYVSPEVSIQKIKERGKRDYQHSKKDIHESNTQLLKNTSEAYLYFCNKKENWILINEMSKDNKQLPIDIIADDIYKKITSVIE